MKPIDWKTLPTAPKDEVWIVDAEGFIVCRVINIGTGEKTNETSEAAKRMDCGKPP